MDKPGIDNGGETSGAPRAGGVAEVIPVPAPYAGKVLTTWGKIAEFLVGLSPVVTLLAGTGMALGGFVHADARGYLFPSRMHAAYAALLASGLALAVASVYVSLWRTCWLSDLYLRARARRLLALRPDPLVHARDPRAVFVEVVPPENWRRVMLETATDVGFLLVDREKGELRFEGDRERWRIPAGAILSCEMEATGSFISRLGRAGHQMIVLRARHPDPDWERSVSPREGGGNPGSPRLFRRAMELRLDILALAEASEGEAPEGRTERTHEPDDADGP